MRVITFAAGATKAERSGLVAQREGPLALNWKLSATGDFNADGKAYILWRNTTSQKLVIWTMNGGVVQAR